MLYKLDKTILRPAPRTLRHDDGRVTCNPTDAQLAAAGYMPLIDDPPPEYDAAKQHAEEAFVQEAGRIRKVWMVKDKPPDEQREEPPEEPTPPDGKKREVTGADNAG